MAKLNKVEGLVKGILVESPEARDDDDILYMKVVEKYGLGEIPVKAFLKCRRTYRIPSYESVGRCRRKLQEKYEEFRGSRASQETRTEEEGKYIVYALKGETV